MIGLDTTALIDLWKNKKEIIDLLRKLDDRYVTTMINYSEIMLGVNRNNPKNQKELDFFDKFFSNVRVLILDLGSGKRAVEIYWKLAKKGQLIDENDSLNAGILLSNHINKIITRNVKHFENIEGLKVISY